MRAPHVPPQSRDWLVLLPVHLGDALCAGALLRRCRAGPGGAAALDVVTSEPLRALFAAARPVRRAFSYDDPGAGTGRHYRRVVDLSCHPAGEAVLRRARFDRAVARDLPDTGSIRVRDGALRTVARCRSPTFDPEGTGPGADPNLPIWMLHAPLVARALDLPDAAIWRWLARGPDLGSEAAPRPRGPGRGGGAGPRVALVPCGSPAAKRWPEARWLALARAGLAAGWRLSLVLGPRERGALRALRALPGPILRENVPLAALARELRRQDLVVANDCGPMHLAAAQGVPTLALFGPTNPRCWFFYRGRGRRALRAGRGGDPWGRIARPGAPWCPWPAAAAVMRAARGALALRRERER